MRRYSAGVDKKELLPSRWRVHAVFTSRRTSGASLSRSVQFVFIEDGVAGSQVRVSRLFFELGHGLQGYQYSVFLCRVSVSDTGCEQRFGMEQNDRNIVIGHKDYDVRGGGERLAEELARMFDAELVVGRRDRSNEPDEAPTSISEIDYSPLGERVAKWMIDAGGARRALAYQLCWQQQDTLADADTVILSGNEPCWWVPRDTQAVIAYTHSTPRFAYDLFHDTDEGLLNIGYNTAVRAVYQHNVTRPDLFVANSDLVARRIKRYWSVPDEKIRVVYPPVRTHEYSPEDAETGDFYLHLGRLAGHKRIDELVEAFNHLNERVDGDYPLVIAGKGPEKEALEDLVETDNIEFAGYVSEERKQELMSGAAAHIYPALNEDFGMVPVESMAAGTPVIGVHGGFTRFQIQNGENGVTFDRESTDAIERAVQRFEREGVLWGEDRIAEFASTFSVAAFREGMHEAVEDAREMSRVETPWTDGEGGRLSTLQATRDVVADGSGGDGQ